MPCYFSIRREMLSFFCGMHRYYRLHHRVIDRDCSHHGSYLWTLRVTLTILVNIEHIFLLFPSSLSPSLSLSIYFSVVLLVKKSSRVYTLNIVGTVNEKTKTRLYLCVYSPSTNIVPWSISPLFLGYCIMDKLCSWTYTQTVSIGLK